MTSLVKSNSLRLVLFWPDRLSCGLQERRDLFGAPYDFRLAADGLVQVIRHGVCVIRHTPHNVHLQWRTMSAAHSPYKELSICSQVA